MQMAAPLATMQNNNPSTHPTQVKIAASNANKRQPAAAAASKQWSDLFKAKSKPSGSFQLQKWDEDNRQIREDELRDFGVCLVGFILGRFPGMQAVDKVRRTWDVEHSFTIHESGWLVFRFSTEQDRDAVLQKGPYESNGSAWILKKMPQFFTFNHQYFNTIPTWVRLQGLPLDFWSASILGKLASYIGEPVAADECTAELLKTSYARLLVEVDVTKPLVRQFTFKLPNGSSFTQDVIYEREPKFCGKCRMTGHNILECRKAIHQSQQPTANANTASSSKPPGSPALASSSLPLGDIQQVLPLPHPAAGIPVTKPIVMVRDEQESNITPHAELTQTLTRQDPSGKGKNKLLESVVEEEIHDQVTTPATSKEACPPPMSTTPTKQLLPATEPEEELQDQAQQEQHTSAGETENAVHIQSTIGQKKRANKKTRSGKRRGPNQASPT